MLLERDHYTLGSTVVVRAQLNDAQHEPLTVPEVSVQVARPDFSTTPVKLMADKSRPGMYSGQFPVLQPGSYQLELLVPESTEPPLVKRLVVTSPQLEIEDPRRRDDVAQQISEGTGGRFYIGMEAALGQGGGESVVALLDKREQTRTTYESESRDREWDEIWMRSILFFVCGCLCLEWLIRRVCRLS
ncbi:MAG: hypothetical protein SGJ20_18150 [Planctomycetota bacterium]|nr:hypothetical protein [Planctomycetota bacterium]